MHLDGGDGDSRLRVPSTEEAVVCCKQLTLLVCVRILIRSPRPVCLQITTC